MGKRYEYGYKDSHSQMKIPKFSPTWQAWRAGKIKPKNYFDCRFYWEVKIEYFDLIEELENNELSFYSQLFDYKNRDYANTTRELMESKLSFYGKTIKSSIIRLIRL